MTIHYDEKGKFYTDIISKKDIYVTIQTNTHRIEGIVHARRGDRLKDELNSTEKFLAVTDAVIFGEDDTKLYSITFLAVHRDNIIWIFPTSGDEVSIGEIE